MDVVILSEKYSDDIPMPPHILKLLRNADDGINFRKLTTPEEYFLPVEAII